GALSTSLPAGMDILTYLEVPDGAPKLAKMLRATIWELSWRASDPGASDALDGDDTLADELQRRCAELQAATQVEVIRHRPDGDRTIDVRPAVLALAASTRPTPSGATTILRAVLRNDGPTVRPTDLHAALNRGDVAEPHAVLRCVQGAHEPEGVRDALGGEVELLVPDVDAEAA
ncbi:MAG: DUF2344 domain-containing protein, partial [Nitriliruptoraceae bacterium]